MASDLISREALLKEKTFLWDEALGTCACVLVSDIKKAPDVDAEPVRHGEWVPDMYFNEPVMRCTACKRGFSAGHKAERFSYCPNCGAMMDGGKSND